METVKLLLISLLVFVGVNCSAQNPNNGIYRYNYGYLCIKNDTVIMDFSTHHYYYMGLYKMDEGELILNKNELIGRSGTIHTEKCSPDSIEIKLICKYEIVMEEADKHPRQSMNCGFYSDATKGINSKDDGCIYIGLDENQNKFNIENFYVGDYVQFQFYDIFKVPLEYGKRYVITQKNNASVLFLDGDMSWVSFKVKRHGKRIEMYHKKTKRKRVFHYVGECDSCLEEFSKQFPGLIE
ncbi:MAG: hypothetical protein Q4F69_06280 [Bacteroidia bacterium]|nr:hypothetical protein [Bacteroidia bacterium]